jgi:predicted nucleic acid-binding protein
MLVVDASCLFEVVASTPGADAVRTSLREDDDQAAPHLVDAEVLGVIRKHHELGRLDDTAAQQAVMDLRDWPGERFGHRSLLQRAWQLRATVRASDALYVALAEALDAPLLTADARLAGASGPRCEIRLAPAG